MFLFRLDANDRDRGPSHETYGPVRWLSDVQEFADETCRALASWVAAAPSPRAAAVAERQIESRGLELARRAVPEALRRRLAALSAPDRRLQIVSTEPWLPWQLCRLERVEAAGGGGLFLCEAFVLTHFPPGLRQPTRFPLERLAIVAAADTLPAAHAELERLEALVATSDRRIDRVEPRLPEVLEALDSGGYDAWHFVGHALFDPRHPDGSMLHLDDGRGLTPRDLLACPGFGLRRPLVVWNGCATARTGQALTGLGGWPQAVLEAGAGAFLGTSWAVADELAGRLSAVLYEQLLGGATLAEATQAGRDEIRVPGDPSWVAYCLYANPDARVGTPSRPPVGAGERDRPTAELGVRRRLARLPSPSARRGDLLRLGAASLGVGALGATLGRTAVDRTRGQLEIDGGLGAGFVALLVVLLALAVVELWRGGRWLRRFDRLLWCVGLALAACLAVWNLVS
ncbi:MAG: CHAT domain-containing protein [Acidobacteriota bacterium]